MEYRSKISKMLIRCGFIFLLVLALSANALAVGVQAHFDLSTPQTGPIPSDWFTVPDETHNTEKKEKGPGIFFLSRKRVFVWEW